MKLKHVIPALALLATTASAQFTLSGNALRNAPGTALGDFGLVLVDINGVGFSNSTIDIDLGESLGSGATYGDFFVILAPKAFAGNTSTVIFNASVSNVPFDGGVTTGDRFAIVTFENSSTTALANDTWRIWTDSTWLVPAAGGGITFSTTPGVGVANTLGSTASPVLTGVVQAIPEPSSFAALAGLAVVGMAATRRRRSA